MKEVSDFIGSVGFPIAVAAVMVWNNLKIMEMLNKHYSDMVEMVQTILNGLAKDVDSIVEEKNNA